jgi:hypothetical protein
VSIVTDITESPLDLESCEPLPLLAGANELMDRFELTDESDLAERLALMAGVSLLTIRAAEIYRARMSAAINLIMDEECKTDALRGVLAILDPAGEFAPLATE